MTVTRGTKTASNNNKNNNKNNSNGNNPKSGRTRLVHNLCSICLDSYGIGSTVTWSSNDLCEHVFHEKCILDWLHQQKLQQEDSADAPPPREEEGSSKNNSTGSLLCPCCRQDFVTVDNIVANNNNNMPRPLQNVPLTTRLEIGLGERIEI